MTAEQGIHEVWLSARAEEILSRSPGAAYPEQDREFHERTMELIQRFARGFTHGNSYSLFNTDDLVQLSSLHVMQGFSRCRGQHFKTWVRRVVANAFISLLRSDRRQSTTSVEELASQKTGDTYSADEMLADPVDVFVEGDTHRWAESFLKWLRQRNRKHADIMARHLEGWTNEEIATELGTPCDNVRSVVFRAPRYYGRFLMSVQKERLKQTQQAIR